MGVPLIHRLTLKCLGVILGATSKQKQNHNVVDQANIYLNCAFPKVTQQVCLERHLSVRVVETEVGGGC